MGGGQGQTTQTTNTASYPAQFQPLATSAVRQIQALQNALPVAQFAGAQPAQIAGISPFQQATMNFLPNILAPSWGLQQLQELGTPMANLANQALNVGNASQGYTNAANALGTGGFGVGSPSNPVFGGISANPLSPLNFSPTSTQPTVAGPGTGDLVSQLLAQLSQPVPQSTPTLTPAPIQPGG